MTRELVRIAPRWFENADPSSVLEHYRALIRLRHEEPTVALGDFKPLLQELGSAGAGSATEAAKRRSGRAELALLPAAVRQMGLVALVNC